MVISNNHLLFGNKYQAVALINSGLILVPVLLLDASTAVEFVYKLVNGWRFLTKPEAQFVGCLFLNRRGNRCLYGIV